MATETQTKLVGFCLGDKTNYNATSYANHIWFDPTNKQILLNGIEYIPKKLSELVNDSGFLTSITKSMVENVLTGNITSHTHSYLPLSGGTMSNTNKVTNLNADLLDGYHASSFYTLKSIRSDQNSIYDLRYNYGTYDKGDFQGTYKDEYPTNYGVYLALAYNDKDTGALMFFDTPTSNVLGHIYVRTRGAGNKNTNYSEWGTLAYLTDNVASSSKWLTPRTITLTGSVTGSVSIDGSANVSLATTTNHTHTFASITSKPTTLSGYGITDAMHFETYDAWSYVNASFSKSSLAQKAANSYIEFWQSSSSWFNLKAGKFITAGGTSAQFLKGDGSLDSNTYALASDLGKYLPLTGGTLSGDITFSAANKNIGTSSVPLSELWTKGVSSPTTLIIGAGTSVMTFDKDGNVAIGKSSVSKYKLDVSGSIYSMSGGITSADGFIKLGSSDSYVLLAGGGTKAVSAFATTSVATASADGLMSAAMFKAQMVKSVGVQQGDEMVKPDGTITITDHRVYITQDKSNINGVYGTASGDVPIQIPNATKDYDGSMSYTDKRKLSHVSDNGYCTVASVFTMNVNGSYTNLDALAEVEFSASDFAGMTDVLGNNNESVQPEFIRLKLLSTGVVYGYTLYESDNYLDVYKYVCYPHNSEIVYDGGMVYIQPIS